MDIKGTYKRWEKKYGTILVFALGLVTSIALLIFILWSTEEYFFKAFDSDEAYKQFKVDTTVMEGRVNERYIQNDNGQKERYLLVTYNDDSSRLVNVNEKQFNAYDKGSKVKFRIDRTKDNEVVVDLKKHKDINNKEAYKQYKNNDN